MSKKVVFLQSLFLLKKHVLILIKNPGDLTCEKGTFD
jgi:hypothetical protein